MKHSIAALTVGVVVGLASLTPAGAVDPVRVLVTRADEWNPAASQDYVAWQVWDGKTNTVYAKPFGGSRTRISPVGSEGYTGSIDGTSLIYQRYSHTRGTSDLYVADLVTEQQTRLPAPINTTRWEYDPSMSGDLIAFARWFRDDSRKIYLWDGSTSSLEEIASSSGARRVLRVGQVNGEYLVYEHYAFSRERLVACDVYRYDVSTETTTRIPNPNTRCQYSPSVDPSGTVFFGRSGFGCGLHATLKAYPIDGPATTLTSLADDRDFATSYAVDNGDGTTDVYFDPFRCGGRGADIYKVTRPAATNGLPETPDAGSLAPAGS